MTEAQAQSLINYLNFDAYYADTRGVESEEVVLDELLAQHRKEIFELIVELGGFSEEERRRIFHLEAQLPFVNTTFRKYPHPGE